MVELSGSHRLCWLLVVLVCRFSLSIVVVVVVVAFAISLPVGAQSKRVSMPNVITVMM